MAASLDKLRKLSDGMLVVETWDDPGTLGGDGLLLARLTMGFVCDRLPSEGKERGSEGALLARRKVAKLGNTLVKGLKLLSRLLRLR